MLTLSRKLPRIWAFRWQVLLSLMNLIEPRSKQKDRQHWYRVSNRADQSKYWWLQSSGEYYRDLLRGHQGQGNTDNTTRQTEYTLIRPWPVSSFSRPTWQIEQIVNVDVTFIYKRKHNWRPDVLHCILYLYHYLNIYLNLVINLLLIKLASCYNLFPLSWWWLLLGQGSGLPRKVLFDPIPRLGRQWRW